MRILQLVNYMYPNIGGIEQVARDIGRTIQKYGYEQKILCFNENSEEAGISTKREETVHDVVDGVEVIRCGCVMKAFSQSLSFSAPKELAELMKSFHPDIVIFHYPNPFMASFLLRQREYPFRLFVYWHLDITKQKLIKKLFHFQNIRLIRRAEKILGATELYLSESEYADSFSGKKQVLPYMIEAEKLKLREEDRKTVEKIRETYSGKTICFALGRHVKYKGLSYLIQASKELDDSFIILIGGEGELTQSLKNQAADDSKIVFLGKLTEEERRAFFNVCDIFCFPSVTKNEAFGLSLAEAMCCGKPTITFHIPGSGVNSLNINGETGIECPNSDSHAFADAIKVLAANPQLREKYGSSAKKRVEENYSKSIFEQNIRELLK